MNGASTTSSNASTERTPCDEREQVRLRLVALVEEGVASGPATSMSEADWAELDAIAGGKALQEQTDA